MPKFRYRALSEAGKVVTGTIDGENRQMIMERLQGNGLKPLMVQKVHY